MQHAAKHLYRVTNPNYWRRKDATLCMTFHFISNSGMVVFNKLP